MRRRPSTSQTESDVALSSRSLDPAQVLVPFRQPAIVTIPLGVVVLIVVSLLTRPKGQARLEGART